MSCRVWQFGVFVAFILDVCPRSNSYDGFNHAICHEVEERYVLLEKIGRGSSGQVFRARRKEDDMQVALKFMSATSTDVVVSRRAEFEILGRLSHPNIVKALEFFCSDCTAVLALSYHAGGTLCRAVRDSTDSRLSETAAQLLFYQLMSAVSYLHEHRIVHRDVKADNVLVSPDLMDLHLVDFNTARPLLEGGSLTMTGTTEYAAPEVLNGESPSEQHDVWGAGLCLHLMLIGSLPHRISGYPSLTTFAAAVCAAPVLCQSVQWEAISPECQDVVKRCLAITKHARPSAPLVLTMPWLNQLAEPLVQRRLSTYAASLTSDDEPWQMLDSPISAPRLRTQPAQRQAEYAVWL